MSQEKGKRPAREQAGLDREVDQNRSLATMAAVSVPGVAVAV
jgi:hypothetical protein